MPDPAILLLEDGRRWDAEAFGARTTRTGEVVFNTSMAGYQEIATDPSYAEQIVTMTAAQIGNYGVCEADDESAGPQVHGFCVRELSRVVSSWRATSDLGSWLERSGVPGITGLDTRSLTRHLRTRGAMRGILSTDGTPEAELRDRLAAYRGLADLDLASRVSCREPWEWPLPEDPRWHVVVVDFGVKRSIVSLLAEKGPARVTVVPAWTTAEQILALKPDGVLLSNGPGDPQPIAAYAAREVQAVLGRVPLMGICMGIQVLGIALGGRTFKLPFGHRGGNQPVKNLRTGVVEITAQNHGFCVDIDSLEHADVELTHLNLNDGTLEGFACRNLPAFAVQYHPEASPGPHDARYLFDDFYRMLGGFWGRRD